MPSIFLEGFLLQASLIFALGAQNLFVLESGLKREHPLVVSLVCCLCDLALIMLGVAGAATLLSKHPEAKITIGVIGVVFLFQYGLGKFLSTATSCESGKILGVGSLRRSVMLSITFSMLNPHAYLDAFVLIGGYSTKYAMIGDRLTLGLGAAAFSGLWFLILSSASTFMKPLLGDPLKMRKIMIFSGILLMVLSGRLGWEVAGWINVEFLQGRIVDS
jgi:L-lysine exporter family protein LysE/ArgO